MRVTWEPARAAHIWTPPEVSRASISAWEAQKPMLSKVSSSFPSMPTRKREFPFSLFLLWIPAMYYCLVCVHIKSSCVIIVVIIIIYYLNGRIYYCKGNLIPYSLPELWVYLQLWGTISLKFRAFSSNFVYLICRGVHAIISESCLNKPN